jgi:arylsulfatase A-like enzyme
VWFYYSEGEVPEEVFEHSGWSSGNHKPDGIFLAWGPDIRPGEFQGAHINDFTPTILAGLGLPIPDDVDGRPLVEIFDRRSKIRPLYQEATIYESKTDSGHNAATDAAITERLRGLGYLQ